MCNPKKINRNRFISICEYGAKVLSQLPEWITIAMLSVENGAYCHLNRYMEDIDPAVNYYDRSGFVFIDSLIRINPEGLNKWLVECKENKYLRKNFSLTRIAERAGVSRSNLLKTQLIDIAHPSNNLFSQSRLYRYFIAVITEIMICMPVKFQYCEQYCRSLIFSYYEHPIAYKKYLDAILDYHYTYSHDINFVAMGSFAYQNNENINELLEEVKKTYIHHDLPAFPQISNN